ncbi:MAG: sulfite exporter TauE/SafE family protein [Clostridia bacterium]|nr:sulfite exporter TauE/SafE family protein [Clostridia bacterium]
MIFWEILAGILGGIIGGMGMGGGTLTIPILTLFLGYQQIQAQGINLVAFLPMAVVALFIHTKNKLVDYKNTWLFSVIGSVFSIVGALIANHLDGIILKRCFAVFLIALGIYQIIEMVKEKKKSK